MEGDKLEKIALPRPHNIAKIANEAFGKNAATYDAVRPGYTEKSIELVLDEIVLPKERGFNCLQFEILELGAGTGRLTEVVAPRIPSGYRYLATEPSEKYLAHFRSKSLPVETANTSASNIPLADNSVQTILCGTSLHWFCDEESLKEIHRVLVPGGKLISLAYIESFEEGSWMMELYKQRFEVLEKAGSSTKTWVPTMEWKAALDATGLFTTARQESIPGTKYPGDLNSMLEMVRTISCYSALPSDECQTFLDQLKQNILAYPDVNPDDMMMLFTDLIFVFTTK